jgi:hypothetical protein
MAKAVKREIPIPPPPPRFNVELSLTGEEAVFLVDISEHIGGDSRTSRRRLMDTIGAALRDAGVHNSRLKDIDERNRSIYFKDSTN